MLKPDHIRILKLAGLPHETILMSFDMNAILRGAHYFQIGRVTVESFEQDEGNILVRTSVKGTHRYVTTTTIDRKTYRIYSACSCPVGFQCKHGVASVLEYAQKIAHQDTINQARSNNSLAVQLWLTKLAKIVKNPVLSSDENKDKNNNPYHIVYILSQSEQRTLNIEVCKAKQLKRGGYGQNYRISYDHLAQFTLDGYQTIQIQDNDYEIIRLIASREYRYRHSIEELGPYLAKILLEMVLKSQRAFWRACDQGPLQLVASRIATFHWMKQEKKHHLTLQTTPAINYFFTLTGALYFVDLERAEIGALQHDGLKIDEVMQLLQAPPVSELEAERVSERLLEILPEADIPLPSPKIQPQIQTIQAKTPIIHVRLHTHYSLTLEQDVHVASVHFDYGGHLVQPEDPTRFSIIIEGNKRYRIFHDMEAEQAAGQQLMAYGFDIPDAFFEDLSSWDMVMASENTFEIANQWSQFLAHGVPKLQEQGWYIQEEDSFALEFDEVDEWLADITDHTENNAWFELSLGFDIDGKRINLLPLLVQALQEMDDPLALKRYLLERGYILVPLEKHRWVKLESSRLITILDTLIELFDHDPLNANGNLDFNQFQITALHDLLNDPKLQWKGAKEMQELSQKLHDFNGITEVVTPEGLNATLRPYQQQGLNWLQFLREYQFNGILADDMGLGKTLQTLSHLLTERKRAPDTPPSLVIAPTSLMSNWRRETENFTPNLKIQVLHGTQRKQYFDKTQDYDVLITTYALIVRDEEFYSQQTFHYLILDEAQAIKNAKAKTTQAIMQLKAQHRLCLTGTPMENHLGELWSMFHFLMPGFLANQQRFTRLFRHPIEKHQDGERQLQLRKRIQPFMLRRTKEHVANELPAKTEIIRTISLEGKQRDLYETVRLTMDKKLREQINQKGLARSHIMILDALLKLRQVCCDPRLVKLERAKKIKQSAKLELLMTMLPEMVSEGRKILLFSQFTSMLALIEYELIKRKIHYSQLTGQTHNREEAIDAFQLGDAKVFLISLKAGGTGLNLTAADTVIHYDPWWNPAAEQQATDRAYRIGQDKPVFVYKLITEETVEEKILKLQQRKQALADGLYSDSGSTTTFFSQEDLMDLLRPLSDSRQT